MSKLEIEVPNGKKAEWVNGVLTLVEDKPQNIMERVQTFEDACNELGKDHPLVLQYTAIDESLFPGEEQVGDLIAYLKLRIIAAALNEGWEPKFTQDEYRYFPWFYFYTEEEISRMDDEGRRSIFRLPSTADYGGVAYAVAPYVSSYTYSSSGSRLAFKNSELAKYSGKQFIDIWADYIYSTPVQE